MNFFMLSSIHKLDTIIFILSSIALNSSRARRSIGGGIQVAHVDDVEWRQHFRASK